MRLDRAQAFEEGCAGRSSVLYDPALGEIVHEAFTRFDEEMLRQAPFVTGRLSGWLSARAPQGLEAAFKAPRAYPMLLLPWLLGQALCEEPDLQFHRDLTWSTINGYLYIRLVDDLMDGDGQLDLKLLPAAGLFHHRFEAAYRPYFAHGHPFWDAFDAAWCETVEATVEDACLTDIGEPEFRSVCGRKFAAAKIPIAAVCHRYGRPDLLGPWSEFLDGLGCWYQMANDLFDWLKDEGANHRTYVLCEAGRRRREGELTADWMVREGFEWGTGVLFRWMEELKAAAGRLECRRVLSVLRLREGFLARQEKEGRQGLESLRILMYAFRSSVAELPLPEEAPAS